MNSRQRKTKTLRIIVRVLTHRTFGNESGGQGMVGYTRVYSETRGLQISHPPPAMSFPSFWPHGHKKFEGDTCDGWDSGLKNK